MVQARGGGRCGPDRPVTQATCRAGQRSRGWLHTAAAVDDKCRLIYQRPRGGMGWTRQAERRGGESDKGERCSMDKQILKKNIYLYKFIVEARIVWGFARCNFFVSLHHCIIVCNHCISLYHCHTYSLPNMPVQTRKPFSFAQTQCTHIGTAVYDNRSINTTGNDGGNCTCSGRVVISVDSLGAGGDRDQHCVVD